jgi:hypothetical protein
MSDQEQVRRLAGATHVLPIEPSAENEIEALRAELTEERARRIFAEAIAEERAQALEDARLALRAVAALQPPPEAEPEPEPDVSPGDEPRPRPKGNWLR